MKDSAVQSMSCCLEAILQAVLATIMLLSRSYLASSNLIHTHLVLFVILLVLLLIMIYTLSRPDGCA